MCAATVRFALAGLIVAATPLGLKGAEQPVRANEGCAVAADIRGFAGDLPAARAAVAEGRRLTIVALGSSTTLGRGASSEDYTYPAVLQRELRRLLAGREVHVVNAGVGGSSAQQMYQRMDVDVLEEAPQLVIWQTGIHEAIHNVGIEKFRRILRKGIARMREAGVDVVLMDQVPAPGVERFPAYRLYIDALREVAAETATPVFRRHELFTVLLREGRLSPGEIVPADGSHLVDASYFCTGVNLARTLAEHLSTAAPPR